MNIAAKVKQLTHLAVIETISASVVFVPGGVDTILGKIEAEVRATKTDISTASGRQAVASLAYKVARSKTALDEMGKELVSELKAKTGAIDAERRTIRDRLDALKDEVRRPLTDWENADKARIEAHEKAILDLEAMLDFGGLEPSAAQLQERIDILAKRPSREWQEFVQRASEVVLRVGAVRMQRDAAGVESARAAKTAGLDLEHVVVARPRCIDPMADGVAQKRRLEIGRPIAPVGEDAPIVLDVVDQQRRWCRA